MTGYFYLIEYYLVKSAHIDMDIYTITRRFLFTENHSTVVKDKGVNCACHYRNQWW